MTAAPAALDRPPAASHAPGCDPCRAAPRWLALWNPAAGNGSPRRWRRYERALRTAGAQVDVIRTSGPGDAVRLAAAAVRDGHRQLLVAGGDGSVHEAVNGVMQALGHGASSNAADASPPGVPPLIVPVPLGTGNDWVRTLGLPSDPARFATTVRSDHVVARHDVGRMQFEPGPRPPRWFVNVAGAGLDADVIASLPARVPSRFAYLGHALRRLGRYQPPTFRLAGPGVGEFERRLLLAFVAIGQYCGHAMRVAPTADCSDGLFDVVAIDRIGLVRALPKLAKLYRGTLLGDPVVTHRITPALRIDADRPVPVEADGQFVGTTPVALEVVPAALRVLRVPRPR